MKPILVFALGLLAIAASAQELSKDAKIERILKLSNSEAVIDQVASQMRTAMATQLPPGTPPAQRTRMDQAATKAVEMIKARMDKLRPQIVKIYAETFSAAEIDGLLAFYESPAGKAMVEKTPALAGKTTSMIQAMINEVAPEIQKLADDAARR